MMIKQERFRKEFEKFKFQFDSHNLDLPRGKAENERELEESDPLMKSQFDMLGGDLLDIANILFPKSKNLYQAEGQIIEYN